MNWTSVAFDWNQARAFLATVEEGSLSAAARVLGQTQPTLSRQVAELERHLGVALFDRVGKSLVPTPSGLDLLEHFRAMRDAATRISLGASGRSAAVEGEVSISVTEFTAVHVLPKVLAKLRDRAPGIAVEVIASSQLSDLMRREADIAIRHVRPEQPDLIARKLGQTVARLYAMPSYLDRIGRPVRPEDLVRADFIGFETRRTLLPALAGLGIPLTEANFPLVSASTSAILAMLREGLGIAMITQEMAAAVPGIEPVLPDLPPIEVPSWLVTHRELHTSRRIRLVFDLLAGELAG